MRTTGWRPIPWWLFVLAGVASGLLAGCSSAGRIVVSPDRATPPVVQPFGRPALDLARPFLASKAAGRRQSGAETSNVALSTGTTRRDALNPRRADAVRGSGVVEVDGTASVSPDGKWVAFEGDRAGLHSVWVARVNGEALRAVSGTRLARLPRWSPDGARLMFLARTCNGTPCVGRAAARVEKWEIWMAEPGGGAARRLVSGAVPPTGAAWFPDSRRICYGTGNWLTVLDTSKGAARALRLPSDDSRIVGVPVVSPDGEHIVFAVAGEGAWVASVGDGQVRQLVSEHDVDAFAWAPGGRQIAFRDARDGQWRVRMVK